MYVARIITLVPAFSAVLLGAALVIAATRRRTCAKQDRAALREHAAIQIGYRAGRKAAL